jgi:hypothetical protein
VLRLGSEATALSFPWFALLPGYLGRVSNLTAPGSVVWVSLKALAWRTGLARSAIPEPEIMPRGRAVLVICMVASQRVVQ